MDIRVRLLLAFLPLTLILAISAVALLTLQQQLEVTLDAQTQATVELIDLQQLSVSVLREKEIIQSLGKAEFGISAGIDNLRRTSLDTLDRLRVSESSDKEVVRNLAERYSQLISAYNPIVEAGQAGDSVRMIALYARDRVWINQISTALLVIADRRAELRQQELNAAIGSVRELQGRYTTLISTLFAVGLAVSFGLAWFMIIQVIRPLNRLANDANRFATEISDGQLSPMPQISQLQRLRDAFQMLLDSTNSRQRALEQSLEEVHERVMREEQLRATVQALSVPVIPLQAGVLLLPLIGYLDRERQAEVSRTLFAAVSERRAQKVVLDLSGLVNLGPETALLLQQMAEAVRLLGAEVVLVGIRAEQAVLLSEHGLAESGIATARDIPAVIAVLR